MTNNSLKLSNLISLRKLAKSTFLICEIIPESVKSQKVIGGIKI